jgi:hypothetical protein
VSLNLPKSSEINRFVAKTNFYKQAGITPKLRELIEQQIDRITWANKVAPTTLNISSGEITEFQSFEIRLKSQELDDSILVFIQKSVAYPIIFTIRGGRGSRAAAVLKSTKRTIVVSTEWQAEISFELRGNSTDALYKNYLLQLSPSFAAADGDIDKYVEITRIRRNIDALSAKARKEMQINKRQEIARERHELELELKELLA